MLLNLRIAPKRFLRANSSLIILMSLMSNKINLYRLPDDIWMVDLDSNKLTAARVDSDLPPLPEPEATMLKNHLKQVRSLNVIAVLETFKVTFLQINAPKNLNYGHWNWRLFIISINDSFAPLVSILSIGYYSNEFYYCQCVLFNNHKNLFEQLVLL